MWKSIAVSLVLATLATSAPLFSPTWYSLSQLARFDNDDNGLPLVAIEPINIYDDIYWQGMSLVEVALDGTAPGLDPNSPSNCAAYGTGIYILSPR
jgi:hypothetical protein